MNPKVILVADWLERQVSDSSITDETIWNELKLSKSSFYRLKPKAIPELNRRAGIRQEAMEQANVQEATERAKKGLKSKTDRLLLLQEQIEEILEDLVITESTTDKAYLRKVIKDLQSEISKIEGDYAAEKRTHEVGETFIDFLKQTSGI